MSRSGSSISLPPLRFNDPRVVKLLDHAQFTKNLKTVEGITKAKISGRQLQLVTPPDSPATRPLRPLRLTQPTKPYPSHPPTRSNRSGPSHQPMQKASKVQSVTPAIPVPGPSAQPMVAPGPSSQPMVAPGPSSQPMVAPTSAPPPSGSNPPPSKTDPILVIMHTAYDRQLGKALEHMATYKKIAGEHEAADLLGGFHHLAANWMLKQRYISTDQFNAFYRDIYMRIAREMTGSGNGQASTGNGEGTSGDVQGSSGNGEGSSGNGQGS